MNGVSKNGVFCDFLTVTCNPDQSFLPHVQDLIRDYIPSKVEQHDRTTKLWFSGAFNAPGLVRLDCSYHNLVDRVSVSGSALSRIRDAGILGYLVQELSLVAHNVTRWDGACDIPLESPVATTKRLNSIFKRGATGKVSLGRKLVPSHNVSKMFGRRQVDDLLSGSVMFNHRKQARHSAIVYDKRKQLWDKLSFELGSELLRYEVRTSEASLRDVLEPDPRFYSLASPGLLPCPPEVSSWQKVELAPMNLKPLPELTDWQRAMNLLDNSPDIEALCLLASRSGAGMRRMLLRKLGQRLAASSDATPAETKKTA